MGSMVVFFFSGIGMTVRLLQELHHAHSWLEWPGTYDEVLPYVRAAFQRVLDSLRQDVPGDVRDNILRIVRELCEPDPKLRGHPLNRGRLGSQYSLERYVSEFNLLAARAEAGLLKGGR
jgi:hypothetical protein